MKYSKKRMVSVALIGAILLSSILIFTLEKLFMGMTSPLVTNIFAIENYEYSVSIPDYWERYTSETSVIYTGNNSEYLTLEVSEKTETYNPELYAMYAALEINQKYNINAPEFETTEFNGKYISKIKFSLFETNYIVGFVENDNYIIDFEYKISSNNDINNALDNIITSIERYELKEVELENGTVTEE